MTRVPRAQGGQRERALVDGDPKRAAVLPVELERLLDYHHGAIPAAQGAFQLTQVGQRGRKRRHVAGLAIERDGFLQEGTRRSQLAEVTIGDAKAVQLPRLLPPVAELAPDGQAALEHPAGRIRLALLVHQHAESVRHPGQRRPTVAGRQVHGTLQPPPSFGGVAVLMPERGQRLDQPQADDGSFALAGRVGGRGFQRPGQRGTQVVVLGLQPVQGGQLGRAVNLIVGPFGDPGVVVSVPAPRAVKVVVGFQAFEGILADRL